MGIVYPDLVKANGNTVPKIGHDIFLPGPSKFTVYKSAYNILAGQESSVGIATRQGLGGSEIKSRWERDFPHQSIAALCLDQPHV